MGSDRDRIRKAVPMPASDSTGPRRYTVSLRDETRLTMYRIPCMI